MPLLLLFFPLLFKRTDLCLREHNQRPDPQYIRAQFILNASARVIPPTHLHYSSRPASFSADGFVAADKFILLAPAVVIFVSSSPIRTPLK